MIHIIYMSRAAQDMSDRDLQTMLDNYRKLNNEQNITGMLFYSNGHIAQIMEGEASVLEPLYEKISRDSRHTNVTKLAHKTISHRSFAEWSMTFHPLEAAGFEQLKGFLMPGEATQNPASLGPSDALVLDMVRQAVFGSAPANS